MNESMRLQDELAIMAERVRLCDDQAAIVGVLGLQWFNEHGDLIHETIQKNLITAVGDRLYASRGAGLTTSAVPTGMRLGTGSTAVAKTGAGAAVVTYLAGSNRAFDGTFPSEAAGVVTYKCTWPAGTATTASNITEAVINTDTIANDNATTATAANTVSRGLFASPAPKGALDSLVATWTHTILGA